MFYFCNMINIVMHQLEISILKTQEYNEKLCDLVSAMHFVGLARL